MYDKLSDNEDELKKKKDSFHHGRYNRGYKNLCHELYETLKKECKIWISEYRRDWEDAIADETFCELKEKLEQADHLSEKVVKEYEYCELKAKLEEADRLLGDINDKKE